MNVEGGEEKCQEATGQVLTREAREPEEAAGAGGWAAAAREPERPEIACVLIAGRKLRTGRGFHVIRLIVRNAAQRWPGSESRPGRIN